VKRNDPHVYVRPFDKAEGRRSIRLKGYDYTQPGAHFVTIVTHERELLFDDPTFTAWRRRCGNASRAISPMWNWTNGW
jgi:hypothetical protein